MHHRGMTLQAIFLQNFTVSLADHDRLVKILKRKSLGMSVAVIGLRNIFLDSALRQMAFNTRCHRMMAGLLPGIVLRLHDMAVDASFRIFTEIRQSFRIAKSIETHSNKSADHHSQ